MQMMNRRALLGGLGGLVVGGSVAGLVGSFAHAAEAPKGNVPKTDPSKAKPFTLTRFGQSTPPFSWEPHKLDIKEVGTVAHAGYHHKGYG
ncbi:MAG: hypothetical protein RRY20_07375 [Bilophila sp.]